MKLKCIICNSEFIRYGKQIKSAKTCSKKCDSEYRKAEKNTECTQCKVMFHLKASAKKRYKRTHGYFCSTKCVADFRKEYYLGENNPNFRPQVTKDTDGYKLAYLPKIGRVKIHHAVVFQTLGITEIPKGYNVHHRDCDINNNDPGNLVLLTSSDHRWLHKQFGNATLWAYMHNKITLNELLKWTNNKDKAKILLPQNILDQKVTGVFKLGELLETPEEDNQQPS